MPRWLVTAAAIGIWVTLGQIGLPLVDQSALSAFLATSPVGATFNIAVVGTQPYLYGFLLDRKSVV